MWQWLAQLQQKPKGYRQRFAFTVAASLTSVIALLWLISLPEQFAQLQTDVNAPLEVPEEDVSGFLAGVRAQVAAVGTSIAALRETSEGPVADEGVATSTATSSESTATTSVGLQIPTLSSSTVRQLNPRPIRIATTSAPLP